MRAIPENRAIRNGGQYSKVLPEINSYYMDYYLGLLNFTEGKNKQHIETTPIRMEKYKSNIMSTLHVLHVFFYVELFVETNIITHSKQMNKRTARNNIL